MEHSVSEFIRDRSEDLRGPVIVFGPLSPSGEDIFGVLRGLLASLDFAEEPADEERIEHLQDMEHSPHAPSSAGCVICIDRLTQVRRPLRAIEEVIRVLEPGGTFMGTVEFAQLKMDRLDDYWRMTAAGVRTLLQDGGLEQVEAWEEQPVDGQQARVFFTGRKRRQEDGAARTEGRFSVLKGDGYRASAITRKREWLGPAGPRPDVPIVMPLYFREEETRMCLEQLDEVTDRYSLVFVDNGFEDKALIDSCLPAACIRNEENVGTIVAINQGIAACGDAPYIAVLHSDAMIYEDGWLDHMVDFLERRPDVGIVGFIGRHTIKENGKVDLETTIFNQDEFPTSFKPTWRFTEVATIDGMGFILRNIGLRMDESLGYMHYYDLDMSLQYIEAGYRVYQMGIESWHLAGYGYESAREDDRYLSLIGGDDDRYYDEVREKLRRKWAHMLPITRGYQDESFIWNRVAEIEHITGIYYEAVERLRQFEVLAEERGAEIEKAARHFQLMEHAIAEQRSEIEVLRAALPEGQAQPSANEGRHGLLSAAKRSLSEDGVRATAKRALRRLTRR